MIGRKEAGHLGVFLFCFLNRPVVQTGTKPEKRLNLSNIRSWSSRQHYEAAKNDSNHQMPDPGHPISAVRLQVNDSKHQMPNLSHPTITVRLKMNDSKHQMSNLSRTDINPPAELGRLTDVGNGA